MMWAAAGTGETSTSMLDFSGFAGWHLVPRALIGCCECERGTEPSISQALYLMNSPEFARKIRHRHGLARSLANSTKSPRQIIDELYLATLSRFPNVSEQELFLDVSAKFDRRRASEDILWTLLNSKRFLYVH